MGVYIRGMEMPKNCFCCAFDVYGLCLINANTEKSNEISHNCPLIEIPPHGRLIDADALVLPNNLNDWNSVSEYVHNITDCWKAIDNAPTIIPPEEGE